MDVITLKDPIRMMKRMRIVIFASYKRQVREKGATAGVSEKGKML